MNKNMKKKALLFSLLLSAIILTPNAHSATDKDMCTVYFTGIGCLHCAKADPVVLQDLLNEYPNLVVIE